METDNQKKILDELSNAKRIRDALLEIVDKADKIGYATQFALETDEATARSAFKMGYDLGTQDGYIDCLQKMYLLLEED